MRGAAAALSSLALAGCMATTSGLQPTSVRSGFDGARVVNIAGHGVACRTVLCPGLGAQWSDKNPQTAIVTVYLFNEIKGVTGAQLAIDGRIVTLQPIPGLTNFSRPGDLVKESRRDFTVGLGDVRAVASAQRAWLRVQTTDGYVEEAIIDGATDSKALHALRRFLAEVDQATPR
jgi:hypothetical protein